MSSHGSPTLDLDVRARRIERRIAFVAIVVASMGPWTLHDIDWMFAALSSLAAGLCTAAGFWRAGWIGARHYVTRITWLADGRWLLAVNGGLGIEATLTSGTRRGPGFAWLRWEAPLARSMLLLEGDLAPGQLRRLLVRLAIDRPNPMLTPIAHKIVANFPGVHQSIGATTRVWSEAGPDGQPGSCRIARQ